MDRSRSASVRDADVVKTVAAEIDRSPAQIALAWTRLNPAVTAPIVGARTLAQFNDILPSGP